MAPLPVAGFGPWGNAQLTFQVATATTVVDPDTGNPTPVLEPLEYLAALKVQPVQWKGQEGADQSTYQCSGRLLHPATLDPRITSGSQAAAVINGYTGRFELRFDLSQDEAAQPFIRQTLAGTFRVIGGRQFPPPPPEVP